jgi:hypothetical protein
MNFNRREFIAVTSAGLGGLLLSGTTSCATTGTPPTQNPLADFNLAWADVLPWSRVVDITQVAGADLAEKLALAQTQLAAQAGGVIYFPPGEYRFTQTIQLKSGIILRGAPPLGVTDARQAGYVLPSRFEFPRYEFDARGDGTPLRTAFQAIRLEEPATASRCGLVHLAINRGHVYFGNGDHGACGGQRFVVGCLLRNAAVADPAVPDPSLGQHPGQRFTLRSSAAIDVKSSRDLLIARNRLARSGEDNFTMDGYLVRGPQRPPVSVDGVVFDYDNRPGIYANHTGIGGPGGQGPDGTPPTHPNGFRPGTIIVENYVFCTGRCAIGFAGDRVQCNSNVIRFARGVWRPTVTGRDLTTGSSTNDNRAVEMRGWRWTVSGNDYEVHRNLAHDRNYHLNDGEGLMHEDHVNSTVKDSALTNNRGNAYLSIYKTGGIDGLLIDGNDIRLPAQASAIGAIYVSANRTNDAFPCRNVRIVNNTVAGGDILISGSPAEENVVAGNRNAGPPPLKIRNQARAKIERNDGFTVDETPWQSERERKPNTRP